MVAVPAPLISAVTLLDPALVSASTFMLLLTKFVTAPPPEAVAPIKRLPTELEA